MKKSVRILGCLLTLLLALVLCPHGAFAAVGGVAINETNFPDANFRSAVTSYDKDGDKVLSAEEIAAVTKLTIDHSNITDLTGIEHFTALQELSCYNNKLTTLDLSKNTALTHLDCDNNNLRSINLSKNTALQKLECYDNKLVTLDLSKNTALTFLNCNNNKLEELNLSKNEALKELNCKNNNLSTIVISGSSAIEKLDCSSNKLSTLNLSASTGLTILTCKENQLSSLELAANTALNYLDCGNNNLTTLDLSKNTALYYLDCSTNKLSTLDLSQNTALISLYCSKNNLTSLDLSQNTKLSLVELSDITYDVFLEGADSLNLSSLPEGFNVSNADNWKGGTVQGGVLTVNRGVDEVSYDYDCGNDRTMTVTLQFKENITLPVAKTVVQGGNVAPSEEIFTFALVKQENNYEEEYPYLTLATAELEVAAGAETTEGELTFAIPRSLNSVDGFKENTIYIYETEGDDPAWEYTAEYYRIGLSYDGQSEQNVPNFTLYEGAEQKQDELSERASFSNTYYCWEIPFTKTVVQAGNTAPDAASFSLEIFDHNNSNLKDYSDRYTATVSTDGTGDYSGKLILKGKDIVSEGFFVRELAGTDEDWKYSDAVWYVMPQRTADGATAFAIYAATQSEGKYEATGESADKMSFINTYTYNKTPSVIIRGATIKAYKQDAAGEPLAGASFVLVDSEGKEAYTAISDENGLVCFSNVESGSYTLKEKSAPEGYTVSEESCELTVNGSRVTMDDSTYTPQTFVNNRKAELNRKDHNTFLVGYADGSFGPERAMTRAEVTTMFARLLSEQIDPDKSYSNSFSDVAASHWAADYIGYMQQFGIISGYPDGSFRPDEPVSRAEFAAIASRFEKLSEGSSSFSDVPQNHWAAKYINFAASRGWVTGYEDGSFKPQNSISRAEVAAVTCRLLERSADQAYIHSHSDEVQSFSDMKENHWAYWYVMEAANGHDYSKDSNKETWSNLRK